MSNIGFIQPLYGSQYSGVPVQLMHCFLSYSYASAMAFAHWRPETLIVNV